MLEFLLALLTTATVTALLVPLVKPQLAARDRLASDTAVYRDQLAEVERERGRTLGPSEADAARTEIERRLLAAADRDATADKDAVTAAKGGTQPIHLLVKQGSEYRDAVVQWNGGLRYPTLVKVAKGEAGLDKLLEPKK